MPNPRELSQFGSFVEVDDSTKNIGIATDTTPFIGIGTLSPATKVHVVGDVRVDGTLVAASAEFNLNVDNAVIGIATITTIDIAGGEVDVTNLSADHAVISTGATIGTVQINSGIITSTPGDTVTYYGDAQYLNNVGLAVTYIDNDLSVDGTITADNIILSGGGSLGAGLTINSLVVSGVGTIGGVQLGPSGIVTAGAGTTVVVYHGDGYNLTNIRASELTGFQVAIHRRPASGRWTMGQNITKINVAHDDTFEVEARSGIVTVSIGDAALPPLAV
tara:strand:- start:90 stop:917 length:828 start_codon:yes stop_codon:yes gene_type:complete